MSRQTHHMARIVFDINIPGNSDGYAFQDRISRFLYDDLLPAIGGMFDGLVSADEIIKIDSIEIDLGRILHTRFISAETRRLILQKLRERIELAGISSSGKAFDKKTTVAQHVYDQWLYFLEMGYLPWNNRVWDAEYETRVLENLVHHSGSLIRLSQLLRKRYSALQRLLWQHPDKFLVSLVEIFTGFPHEKLIVFQKSFAAGDMKSLGAMSGTIVETGSGQDGKDVGPGIKRTEFREYFWEKIIRVALVDGQRLDSNDLIRDFVFRWIDEGSPPKNATRKFTVESDNSRVKQERHEVEADLGAADDHDGTGNIWYVSHAGIVLIHPYLNHLFTRCRLIRRGKFRDEVSRYKAVHLLHFLATGQIQPHEHSLHLAKVLCGMEVGIPVPRKVKIPSQWLSESEHLLKTAIERWGALGDVSSASLREGFFDRDGKLVRDKNGWRLQVEQRSIDILLNRLPWGLGMFTLPWTEGIFRIEWV